MVKRNKNKKKKKRTHILFCEDQVVVENDWAVISRHLHKNHTCIFALTFFFRSLFSSIFCTEKEKSHAPKKKKNEASRQSVPIPTEESTPPRNVTYLQKRHRVKNGNDKIRRAYERGDTEQEQEQASADYSNLSFLFFSFRRCNV